MNRKVERTLAFAQEDFDRFAELSGDANPIHVNVAFAAQSRFGRPVAHGVLLCAVLRGLVQELAPGGTLQQQEVMFAAPTFADEPMTFSAAVVREDESGAHIALNVVRKADGETTCEGSCSVLRESSS